MKKIMTLLCAMALVLSANAANLVKQIGAGANVQRVQQVVATTPVDTVEVEATNAVLTDATAAEGWFQFIASNTTYPDIYVCVNSETVDGTYTSADFDYDYTALYDTEETAIEIVEASGVVATADNMINFSFYLIDADAHCYHVYGSYDPSHIQYDEQEYDWAYDFDGEIDDQYVEQYGILLITGENAEMEASISMQFVGEELVAGTYSFSAEGDENTFVSGDTDGQYLYGSFVTTDDYEHIWFMVGGNVTVEANGNITLNAVNSYGMTVTGTIYISATAIENVEATEVKTNKVIRNGQLIMTVNGREYNALGQAL